MTPPPPLSELLSGLRGKNDAIPILVYMSMQKSKSDNTIAEMQMSCTHWYIGKNSTFDSFKCMTLVYKI